MSVIVAEPPRLPPAPPRPTVLPVLFAPATPWMPPDVAADEAADVGRAVDTVAVEKLWLIVALPPAPPMPPCVALSTPAAPAPPAPPDVQADQAADLGLVPVDDCPWRRWW